MARELAPGRRSIEKGTCALCHEHAELRFSHILPKFIWRPLKGRTRGGAFGVVAVSPAEEQFSNVAQDGFREPLLCGPCEHLLNDRYERPSVQLWRYLQGERAAPAGIDIFLNSSRQFLRLDGIDFKSFKLFLLSILWRCHCARSRAFEHVNLGPHADRVRRMLLEGEPGEQRTYPVLIQVMIRPAPSVISTLFDGRAGDGLRCWSIQLCAISLQFFVGKVVPADLARWSISRDGTLIVRIAPPGESPILADAHQYLGPLPRV